MVVLHGAPVGLLAYKVGERLGLLAVVVFFVSVEQVFKGFFLKVQGRDHLGMQIIE